MKGMVSIESRGKRRGLFLFCSLLLYLEYNRIIGIQTSFVSIHTVRAISRKRIIVTDSFVAGRPFGENVIFS